MTMQTSLWRKTHKVLDIEVEGFNLICIVHYDQKTNPYHLYVKWYDGKTNLKQVARYQNFISVVDHVRQWMHNRHVGFKETF